MTSADPSARAPALLHELFEATADAHPDNLALVCGGARLTYRELEARANRLAHHLRSLGVGKDSFVGLLLPRGAEALVALLAALKAGAAYVPLDPDYPAERVGTLLADCGAAAVVTTRSLAAKCGAAPAVLIDADAAAIAGRPERRLTRADTELSPGDPCYVIYTSGSTGRPKGVLIEHRSVVHLVRAERQLFGVRRDDRVYQGFSLAFDASVEEVWLAFSSGAALVVGTADWVRAGPELASRLAAAGVTVFSTVPTLLAMLDEDVPTVRLLILGGEACPQELVARWSRPGRRLVNTYGPTEATVIATYADCDPAKPVTIGKAVPGYHVCVLDEQLRAVPPGVAGEIHIGGPGLARGYVGRDALTREKFVANPAGDGAAPRLYKTGDLGRVNGDGDIEFLGRADTQVKLRGFRVELTEIESALLECDGVRAAAVAVREDIPGVRQFVGYVVPRDGAGLDEQHLRGRLRARLPAYMVPAIIDTLPALPALPSGKVDRTALPPPRGREAKARPDHVAPRTALEEKIAAAWEALFAPASVSVRDDFFSDLGGHSLLAAGMVSGLRKDLDFAALSVRDVYEHPTVEALAAHLETAAPAAPSPARRPVRKASSLGYWLTGFAQLPALYGVMAVHALQWLAPFLVYTWLIESDYDDALPLGDALHFGGALLGGLVAAVLTYPALLALAVVVKWVVIGRFRSGSYPLW